MLSAAQIGGAGFKSFSWDTSMVGDGYKRSAHAALLAKIALLSKPNLAPPHRAFAPSLPSTTKSRSISGSRLAPIKTEAFNSYKDQLIGIVLTPSPALS
jgi:hypothetical protein